MIVRLEVIAMAAVITFDWTEQMNALNGEMVDRVRRLIDRFASDSSVLALLVTGAGGHFMAGADIEDFARQSGSEFRAFQVKATHIHSEIDALPKPVIAAIEGYAHGGGFEIALACKMIISHPKARLGLPEVKLGLIPSGGGTQRLASKLGTNLAAELLMTGRFVEATELDRRDIVNRIVPEPLPASLELAADIARYPAGAVGDGNRLNHLAWATEATELPGGLKAGANALGRLFDSGGGPERIRASSARAERKKQGKQEFTS